MGCECIGCEDSCGCGCQDVLAACYFCDKDPADKEEWIYLPSLERFAHTKCAVEHKVKK